jgi:hypothetical protein
MLCYNINITGRKGEIRLAMTGLAGGFMLCTPPCSGKTVNSTSKKGISHEKRRNACFFAGNILCL